MSTSKSDPREKDHSIKARQREIFVGPGSAAETGLRPHKPFRDYLRETTAAPLPTGLKAGLSGAGVIVTVLLSAALLRAAGQTPHLEHPSAASLAPIPPGGVTPPAARPAPPAEPKKEEPPKAEAKQEPPPVEPKKEEPPKAEAKQEPPAPAAPKVAPPAPKPAPQPVQPPPPPPPPQPEVMRSPEQEKAQLRFEEAKARRKKFIEQLRKEGMNTGKKANFGDEP
ncbi:MAG TPA: hypothetical protein VF590_13990 [Isosphaeraceae bacterium]